jgi:hypothetical protein
VAEVTNAMIFEVLKQLQSDVTAMERSCCESRHHVNAIQSSLLSSRSVIQDIYAVLARQDARLTRIERRLDIVEPA